MAASTPPASLTRLTVFAWLWAFAVVLHLLYLENSYAAFSSFTADHVVHLALAVAAVALLLRPRSLALLATVCVLTPITAWFEAPRLGNHWLFASLVALGLLASMAIGTFVRPRDVLGRVLGDGLPSARLIFLVVYGFCALAKFNTSFIDPTVSCANFFLNEVVQSFGFSQFDATGSSAWMSVVPWVVMAIETSVVVLLLLARTRILGVIVALIFHGIIAFDTAHAFSDFSSVIAALVVLFLPDAFFDRIMPLLSSVLLRLFVVLVAGVSTALLVWQSTDSTYRWVNAIGDVRDWMWWLVWAALTIAVVIWSTRTRTLRSEVAMLPEDRWMVLWPTIAFLIGCGPYLELRTGSSWNMYANLRTVGGSSNSFIIPATAQLSDGQADLVRIVATSDPKLRSYVDSIYELPFLNLRDFTSTNPDASITYVRNGSTISVDNTREDPELGTPLSIWQQKVLTYRSVSATEPVACQNTMLPAR
jgi:hypothetical protein